MEPRCDCHSEPMFWAKNSRYKAGGYWRCFVKKREGNLRYCENNREEAKQRTSDWQQANPGRRTEYLRYKRHNTTLEAMVSLYVEQSARCAGCKERFGFEFLEIDHDHACCPGSWSCGECIRGLLCRSCNAKDVLAIH